MHQTEEGSSGVSRAPVTGERVSPMQILNPLYESDADYEGEPFVEAEGGRGKIGAGRDSPTDAGTG